MKRIRSPITIFGGKGRLVSRMLPLFPPHRIFADVCGGAASVLLAKPPCEVEVYNDVDSGLVNLFRVIRDPALVSELRQRLECTPFSREEFEHCRNTWREQADPVEKARRFFVTCRQSFGGERSSWNVCVSSARRAMPLTCSHWLSAIEGLPQVHERFQRVVIEHADWRILFDRYRANREAFLYLDPPYLRSTRRGGGYEYEWTTEDHEELVDALAGEEHAARVVLSGYASPLYEVLEGNGWQRLDFGIVSYATGRSGRRAGATLGPEDYRVESVWLNYEAEAPA